MKNDKKGYTTFLLPFGISSATRAILLSISFFLPVAPRRCWVTLVQLIRHGWQSKSIDVLTRNPGAFESPSNFKEPYLTILIQYRLYQCADKQFLSLGMDLHFMIFTNQKHCRISLLKSSFVWLYPGKARKYLVTTSAFIVALVVIITSISSSSSSIIKCVCMRMGGFHLLRSLLFFIFSFLTWMLHQLSNSNGFGNSSPKQYCSHAKALDSCLAMLEPKLNSSDSEGHSLTFYKPSWLGLIGWVQPSFWTTISLVYSDAKAACVDC